jgi:hypothetical protein
VATGVWGLSQGVAGGVQHQHRKLAPGIGSNYMLGRVMSIAGVLAWSAIPVGALLGGLAIQQTHNVALVYGAIGVLIFLIPVVFAFTPGTCGALSTQGGSDN